MTLLSLHCIFKLELAWMLILSFEHGHKPDIKHRSLRAREKNLWNTKSKSSQFWSGSALTPVAAGI